MRTFKTWLLILALPAAANAQFIFVTNNDSITITGYAGAGGDVVVPDTLGGLPVTVIGTNAFYACSSLTNLTISDNVTNLEDGAFYGCDNLAGVTLGNGMVSLGGAVFAYCPGLTDITLPDSTAYIGFGAFYSCTGLTNVTFGSGLANIDSSAFYYCTGLTSVVISDSVTNVGSQAFFFCLALTNLAIGNGATAIGNEAFDYCSSLTAIAVDPLNPAYSSVTGALFNKSQDTLIECPAGFTGSYTIPDSVTRIEPNAFDQCQNLTGVTIGNNVTNIGSEAFFYCTSLADVALPDSVVSVGDAAFNSCYSLTNVTIGSGVVTIGNVAFSVCSRLMAITVDVLNPAYASDAGVLFNKSRTLLIQYPGGLGGSYTIPDGVAIIGSYAFVRSALAAVTIPGSVTYIGNDAFFVCQNLTGLTLENGIVSIGDNAFAGCSLTNVAIPGSVAQIGYEAFMNCSSLTNLTIGSGLAQISSDAFFLCRSLRAAYFGGNPPIADSTVFGFDTNAIIYYLPSAAGWGTSLGGRPAILWNPQAQTGDGHFGVQTNHFGFNITGTTNIPIVIEAATNLSAGAWVLLRSLSLTNGSYYFSDAGWSNTACRFYRIRSP